MSLLRLLAAVLASVLLVASAVAIERARHDVVEAPAAAPDPDPTTAPDTDGERSSPSPTPSPPDPSAVEPQLDLLTSTDAAAAAGPDALLTAGLRVAQGPWRSLADPAWPVREERPVYVAEVTIGPTGDRVEADVVIAWRQVEAVDAVVLRALAASTVLQGSGGALETTVELDGRSVEFEEDGAGARIIVPVGLEADTEHLVRVRVAYDLVDANRLSGGGGPAGFGLLARFPATGAQPDIANLGHWLPALTFDPGPMVEWGDVGAFPVAVWSVLVDHPGALVTGGDDGDCPEDRPVEQVCTWGRGVSLREVSAVWFGEEPLVDTERVGGLEINTILPTGTFVRETNRLALREATGSAEVFVDAFGPVAWNEFDVVASPLLEGAAGMEFPGLVIIDLGIYGNLNGQVGTYVIAHEVAHQWFHALVGNGSLSSPVVDESLAQYLTYLFWARVFGEEAADAFARDAIRGRYDSARQQGLVDEPPAQPLEDFAGDAAYGPLVYARAPLAWLAAEERLGRDQVIAFLAGIVDRYGLATISDDELLEEARAFGSGLAGVIERYWFDPAPLTQDTS